MSDTPGWTAPEGAGDQDPPPFYGTPGPPMPPAPPAYGGGWGQPAYGGWGPPPGLKPGVIPLRPLGLGEILDGALTTIRQYPKATLGLSAVVVSISQLLLFVVQAANLNLFSGAGTDSTDEVLGPLVTFVVVAILGAIAGLVLAGMLTIVMGEAVLGRPISLGEVWAKARRRIGGLVGAAFLTSVLIGVGFLLCILPGIYLWVALSLTTPALMLEGQSVVSGMRRSRELVKGDWWRCFGILLLALLISTVLESILTVPFLFAGAGVSVFDTGNAETLTVGALAIQTVGGIIAGTIVSPFSAGVTALLYVDRRMRVEGLDVTLAQAVTAPPPPPA